MTGPGARALQDHDGGTFDLTELDGIRHAIVLLPGAFTPVCTAELAGIARLWRTAGAQGLPVLALACDFPPVLAAWRRAEGVELPLLSDAWPHGAVSRSLDAFDEATGRARRTSLVIDADGSVIWREDASAAEVRDADRVARALLGL